VGGGGKEGDVLDQANLSRRIAPYDRDRAPTSAHPRTKRGEGEGADEESRDETANYDGAINKD